MRRRSVKTITTIAFLAATEVILSRFLSFSVWNMKLGLSFVPIVLAAILLGAIPAGITAGLGDLIGALLFPIGPYFPGFTAVAFVQGVVFGVLLRRTYSFTRTLLAALAGQLLCTLLLNTWNISFLYGAAYGPLLLTRLTQALLLFVLQLIVIPLLYKAQALLRKQVRIA